MSEAFKVAGTITCDTCADELPDVIAAALQGSTWPNNSGVCSHLEECPKCARAYGDLVQVMTAANIAEIEQAILADCGRPVLPPGLLAVWQVHLGLRDHFGDRRAAAMALSVMGMIHRCEDRVDDAVSLHIMALKSWRKPSFSRVRSHTDLGYFAYRQERVNEALRHLQKAQLAAEWIDDGDAIDRIHVLRWKWTSVGAETLAAMNASLYADSLAYAAAAPGDEPSCMAYILNTCRQVPILVWSGPEVDDNGRLRLAIGMKKQTLDTLPDRFLLDVLYVPTCEIVWQRWLDAAERERLDLVGGLKISTKLPKAHGPRGQTTKRRRLPPTACVLRIWWPGAK